MPLVRFEVRNEYGLGVPELYRAASKDDCKAVLDGVVVAGMVGILRQLGDLAELAAEVFQGLQEQVMAIASRSHKMMVRVQKMEVALPPVEKAILAQKSHVHFAYTAGFDWHVNIQPKENQILHSDVPKFIMDSYEECRGPPRLELLDKFDTSGPGACLKRYSNPSLFKTVLAGTDLVNTEKVQGEWKAQNGKKKGSRQRNLEIPHVVPIAYRRGSSSRTQFSPENSFGQNLVIETSSAFIMRSGSELGNGSTSFDSRTTSDNAECAFDASSSIQNKDLEQHGLLTSRLKKQYCEAAVDSALPHEPVGDSHDIYSNRSLQEESINNSSSVTWVEKTEIVKPPNQGSENVIEAQCEASESNSVHSEPNKLEIEASSLGDVGRDDILGDHQKMHESFSDKNQFDEAGNALDSDMITEVETNFNHQTKEAADLQSAIFKNNGTEEDKEIMNMMSAKISAPSSTEPSPSSKHTRQNLSKSVSLGDFHPQPLNSQDPFVKADMHGNTDSLDISVGKDLESAISGLTSSGSKVPSSQASLSDKISNSLFGSQESANKISGRTSSKFWTNGGLLGLEPSKPPDGVVLNSVSDNYIPGIEADEQCVSSETSMLKSHSDESTENVDMLLKSPASTKKNPGFEAGREKNPGFEAGRDRSPECVGLNNVPPDQLNGRLENKILLANHSECSILDHDKKDNSEDSCSIGQFSDAYGCGLVNSITESPIIAVVERPSNENFQQNVGSSAGMFGLNHGLHVNGSLRKVPLSQVEPSDSVKTGLLKSKDACCIQQEGPNRNLHRSSSKPKHSEHFEHESSKDLLSSSPPIQHMKISFNPVGSFETSRLKLKVSDGLHFSDTTEDFIFPSFQLLPEPAIQLSDIDFESDDETLYGSSQYMSDELMSQCSQSSAEQWEYGETHGNQTSMVYDALHRISSVQSISSSLELEGIAFDSVYAESDYKSLETDNGIQTFHSGSGLDLPSFDAIDSSKLQKDKKGLINGNDLDFVLQHLNVPMPLPPPLPPLQWRVRKSQFDAINNNQGAKSEAFNNPKHLQVPASTISQHTKQDPFVQPHTKETAICPPKNEQNQQKLNEWREANQVINGKDADDMEDLLHQIKTKSLKLRRTVSEQPIRKPNPTCDVKVTAILEKANAIRQAFAGSDEEDDDN